jgi:hypothetical protein
MVLQVLALVELGNKGHRLVAGTESPGDRLSPYVVAGPDFNLQ